MIEILSRNYVSSRSGIFFGGVVKEVGTQDK